MRRIMLTDGSDKWFDLDKARPYKEDTEWDGRNTISKATGSQWDHETLYQTATGQWVLHHTSAWQGSMPSWQLIGEEDAALWLYRQDHHYHPLAQEVLAREEI